MLTPHPDAERCVLRGAGLSQAVARLPAVFEIDFCDSLGQSTYAEDLDVFVMPAGSNAADARRSGAEAEPPLQPPRSRPRRGRD